MSASIELGAVTIWLPTAGDGQCSIFQDLRAMLGVATNDEALKRFRAAWREAGHAGRLDLDSEAEGVSISAGRAAIVLAAVLLDRISLPDQRRGVTDEEIARVRAAVKAHRRPPRFRWEVGDVFAVPLVDGTFAFGQVVSEEAFADPDLRAPTCALFEHRSSVAEVDPDAATTSRTLTILRVDSGELDTQRWRVIGRASLGADPRDQARPKTSWDGIERVANAWHGLAPWNPYYRDDWIDRFLVKGLRRPERAIMLDEAALAELGISSEGRAKGRRQMEAEASAKRSN